MFTPFLRPESAMLPALVGVLTGSVRAQLVAYDGFGDYGADVRMEGGDNGSTGTGLEGGFGWGGPYNVSNAIKSLIRIENRSSNPLIYDRGEIVIKGGNRALRFYDIANGSYAVQRPLGKTFSAAAGETLWFSFLFRTASTSPLANQDFFQVGFDDNDDPLRGNPRVSIGANTTSGSSPFPFQFFARSTTEVASSAFHSLPIAAGTTYLLVGRILPDAGSYDTVSLFVDPTDADDPGPPSATVTLSSGLTNLSHAFIRTAFLDNGDAYVLDEWHIGRDYGSVIGSLRNALRIETTGEPGSPPNLRWSSSLTGTVLETSTTLVPGSWEEVPGAFTLHGGELEFTVPTDPGITRGFYRLRR